MDERYKHPVDITWMNRIFSGCPTACQVREGQINLRIAWRPIRIIPKPHIPGLICSRCIAPFDCQRRPIGLIKRHQSARLPTKAQRCARIVERSFISEQRVIERVFAFPDQPCKITLVEELAIHLQRIGRWNRRRCHHGPREVDSPKAWIEPLDIG